MPEKPHLYSVPETMDSQPALETPGAMPDHLLPTHIGKLSLVPEIITSVPGVADSATEPPRSHVPGSTPDSRRSLREEFFATDPHDSPRKPR
jgi:hypothetical protein